MNIGGLYRFKCGRRLHKQSDCEEWFSEVSSGALLVLLAVESYKLSSVMKLYKILTTSGEVGWIRCVDERFEEVKP